MQKKIYSKFRHFIVKAKQSPVLLLLIIFLISTQSLLMFNVVARKLISETKHNFPYLPFSHFILYASEHTVFAKFILIT